MALITNSNALNTAFSPATGAFVVEVGGARVDLYRRVSGGEWRKCGTIENGQSCDVPNSVAGFEYRFVVSGNGTATVAAYQ